MKRLTLAVLAMAVMSGAGIANAAVQVVFFEIDGHNAFAHRRHSAADWPNVTPPKANGLPHLIDTTAEYGYPTPTISDALGFPPGRSIANNAKLDHWAKDGQAKLPNLFGQDRAPDLGQLFSYGSHEMPLTEDNLMHADALASMIANGNADWVAKSKLREIHADCIGVEVEACAIPEPATAVIWSALGCLGLGLVCWRRRRKS